MEQERGWSWLTGWMVKPVQRLAPFCVNSKRQGLEIKSTERLSSSPHELPSAVFGESWAILGGGGAGGKVNFDL